MKYMQRKEETKVLFAEHMTKHLLSINKNINKVVDIVLMLC